MIHKKLTVLYIIWYFTSFSEYIDVWILLTGYQICATSSSSNAIMQTERTLELERNENDNQPLIVTDNAGSQTCQLHNSTSIPSRMYPRINLHRCIRKALRTWSG